MVGARRPSRLLLLGTLYATELAVTHQVYIGKIICKAQGCTTIACFGTAGQSAEFCAAHMLENMVRLPAKGTDCWICRC